MKINAKIIIAAAVAIAAIGRLLLVAQGSQRNPPDRRRQATSLNGKERRQP